MTLRSCSLPSTTTNSPLPLTLGHTCGVPKVRSNKRLNIEIKLESLAEIRGHFGTGVPKY